jgi:hypothetical protein
VPTSNSGISYASPNRKTLDELFEKALVFQEPVLYRQNFAELPFRNCLENSWTGLDRVFLVSQSSDKGALEPVFFDL